VIKSGHPRDLNRSIKFMNGSHIVELLQKEMQFDVSGCNREQKELLRDLKASSFLGNVTSLGPVELE
jgi:hypothetical protein